MRAIGIVVLVLITTLVVGYIGYNLVHELTAMINNSVAGIQQ